MRLVICLLAIVSLVPAPAFCRSPLPSPDASQLILGIHVRDYVRLYSPRYEGGTWNSEFGARLKEGLEGQLRAAFPNVVSLAAFPPPKEAPRIDAYLVVEEAVARFYGRGAMTAEAETTITVFNAEREPVKDIQASSEYKISFTKDTQQARCDAAVTEMVLELVTKLISGFQEPELQAQLQATAAKVRARQEHPAPPAAPAPAPTAYGRLFLETVPAGANVFLDDVYWGASNAEGKLKIAGVPTGTHILRLKAAGYIELRKEVTVVPGDNPVTLKAEVAPPKPLREVEIEDALRNDLPRPRIVALIREFGVDFKLTKGAEVRLMDAGADNEMLLAIAGSKK